MIQRLRHFIDEQHLFSQRDEVLLAVSGGRDSVCMVDLVRQLHQPFAIAHCNFHLRGADSDRDQRFVAHLAEQAGVRYHTVDFDTVAYAAAHDQSIEEAARELRYAWFASLCSQYGYVAVATAHHRDDSVETFFLNLFRGTGIAGLHGIRPASAGVVRPMLCFSRAEIDHYVEYHRLLYVEDCTNSELDARRNRIRLQLMPLLRQLYPSVDATMAANIERLHDAELLYRQQVETIKAAVLAPHPSPFLPDMVEVDLHAIAKLEARGTVLHELLHPFGFAAADVAALATSLPSPRVGARLLSATHEAVVDRTGLLVAPLSEPVAPRLTVDEVGAVDTRCGANTVFVDADKVAQPLSLRPWHDADRFCPFGMGGRRRLVSDLLKDCHVSVVEKRHVHVLTDAEGRIVWVVGLRADDRFRVGDETRLILRLSV